MGGPSKERRAELRRERERERKRLGIPTEAEIQERLRAWLKFYVDKSSKKAVADATGMSLAHISNLYNHASRKPGLDFLICMVFGMDVSARELLREPVPVSQKSAQTPSQTNEPARKQATKG